jgi:hypothetical protein
MKLIPYASQSYTSPLSKESLLQKLRQRITTKHSAVNHENIINHNVLAGEVRESSFTISGNRYGLTYGKIVSRPAGHLVSPGGFYGDAAREGSGRYH